MFHHHTFRRSLLRSALFALAASGTAACSSNSSPAAPFRTPAPSVQRGTVDALVRVTTITKAQMASDYFGAIALEVGGAPLCDVALYSVDYQTIGVRGEQADASAAFFVPQAGCTGPFPLIGYSHGTNLSRSQKITDPASVSFTDTAPDSSPVVVAALLAAHGYAVAATDYLGLGLSHYPFHPYLDAEAEASAVVDSLRAARASAKTLGVPLSGAVFLTGHSQGGQSSVATQRAIERDEPGEFTLLGDAPSSGPYALTQTFLDSLAHQSQDAPILATYILTSYQKIYGNVYAQPTDVFKLPYATNIASLLPVANYQQQDLLEGTTLPLSNAALLQPAFVTSFETDAASVDTAKNDLLGGWTPVAPLFLCGGSGDPEVEYKNATAAQAYFQSVGAKPALVDVNAEVVATGVPKTDYHVTVAFFCLAAARADFFDPIVKSAANHRHL
jgi:pimeloyl-ACP methyl ester carboxylesterase